MKCWWVCDEDGVGLYVLAETRGQAKMYGAREMCLEFTGVRAVRAPEHDGKSDREISDANWSVSEAEFPPF